MSTNYIVLNVKEIKNNDEFEFGIKHHSGSGIQDIGIRKDCMIVKKTLPSYHGRDLDRMIYKKSHTQPVEWSSTHGTGGILGFKKNRHASERNVDSAPNLTGVNRLICVISNCFYDFQRNRIKRKRIGRPVRIRARDRYFQKNRISAQRIWRSVTAEISLIRFQKNRPIPIQDLMSSNYVEIDSYKSKACDESDTLSKYTTTPIRINL